MAIKERKQITGTAAQIKGFAGHNGVLAYATDTKHLHVLSGTAGTTTELANRTDIPDITGKADTTYVNAELAKRAPVSHTHTTAQVTGLDTALAGKANSSHTHTTAQVTGLDTALAGKANSSHTHTVSQITDMPKVVLSVNNIAPAIDGNVNLGLHVVATSGDYNDLRNKPSMPSTPTAYITETWKSTDGTSWYRKWSDGWIEQGGTYYTDDSLYRLSITLAVQMATTQYHCDISTVYTDSQSSKRTFVYVLEKTTSSFSAGVITRSGTWEVCGY